MQRHETDATAVARGRFPPGERPRDLVSMRWEHLLFAHWPVDPAVVRGSIPDDYEVDTFDGDAYLGAIPFVMTHIRPSFLADLTARLPLARSFGEVNLRTYVLGPDGTPGIYFFNLDASDRLSVTLARSVFRLPYYDAEIRVERRGETLSVRSERVHEDAPSMRFRASYGPDGGEFVPEAGTLEHFLTERYRFFTPETLGQTFYADVDHELWTIAPAWAEFEENDLFVANGFDEPGGEPLCHYARGIDVTAGRLHRT